MEVVVIGIVQNEPASVVWLNPRCEETIEVDPSTLVLKDEDAKEVVAEGYDHEAGEATGRMLVDIYCCYESRNSRYNDTDIER